MRRIAFALALAAASFGSASAQLYNPFDQALQNYETNQQLNQMMNDAMRSNQAAAQRGLDMMRGQTYGCVKNMFGFCQ